MQPYVQKLYQCLLVIIQSTKVPPSVTENAAVALGRIGLCSAEELAPHLVTFAYPFLEALSKVVETDEKDTALKGFCMVVGRNPGAMESCLVPFFKCIARYKYPSPELKDLFRQVYYPYPHPLVQFLTNPFRLLPATADSLPTLITSWNKSLSKSASSCRTTTSPPHNSLDNTYLSVFLLVPLAQISFTIVSFSS